LVAREGATCETARIFAEVAAELRRMRPDVIVIFTTDHLNTFFFENLPILAIGVADAFAGSNDDVPGMPRYRVPSRAALARHLRADAVEQGFDLSLAQEFEVDHSTIVPLHFLTPEMRVPVIPIFISGHVPPLPPARRCFAFGEALRNAIERWPEPLRVVAIGSGSFSLDVHGPLTPPGRAASIPDPAWVQRVQERLEGNRVLDLISESTPGRFARAGNVSGELLNWIAMLGTIQGQTLAWIKAQPSEGHAYAVWR
jgi:protocatechuate 4,5-dioxygenase beta chain